MQNGHSLTISLPEALVRFVKEQTSSGQYSSESEVVGEGLRLLADRRRELEALLAEMRRQIAEGAAAADRGDVHDVEDVFAEIEAHRRRHGGKAA